MTNSKPNPSFRWMLLLKAEFAFVHHHLAVYVDTRIFDDSQPV
jgi:hypothetical protein